MAETLTAPRLAAQAAFTAAVCVNDPLSCAACTRDALSDDWHTPSSAPPSGAVEQAGHAGHIPLAPARDELQDESVAESDVVRAESTATCARASTSCAAQMELPLVTDAREACVELNAAFAAAKALVASAAWNAVREMFAAHCACKAAAPAICTDEDAFKLARRSDSAAEFAWQDARALSAELRPAAQPLTTAARPETLKGAQGAENGDTKDACGLGDVDCGLDETSGALEEASGGLDGACGGLEETGGALDEAGGGFGENVSKLGEIDGVLVVDAMVTFWTQPVDCCCCSSCC